MRVYKVQPSVPDLIDKLVAATNFIGQYVVNRSDELHALAICLLTGQHLLLEGLPGIAKSRLAILAFRMFSDARVFRTMFHGTTTADEIVGPPNPKILREKGVIEVNTDGMLPQAHFAYLDELFNGPSSTLNSVLNILNERQFAMGAKVLKCPLQTAVVTTNKVSEDVDLAALLDRFLIYQSVSAADSPKARLKLLTAFLQSEDIENLKFPVQLTLEELRVLQDTVKKVKLPEFFVEMIESTRTSYSSGSSVYISDRRFCWSYRAVQASVLIHSGGNLVADPNSEALSVLADVFARKPEHKTSIETQLVTAIQSMAKAEQELTEIAEMETLILKQVRRYDPDMPANKKIGLYKKLRTIQVKVGSLAPNQQFSSPVSVRKMEGLLQKVDQCIATLELEINADEIEKAKQAVEQFKFEEEGEV